jgi:DNA segregation ATPase FtsK/SpoIIIE-like protein
MSEILKGTIELEANSAGEAMSVGVQAEPRQDVKILAEPTGEETPAVPDTRLVENKEKENPEKIGVVNRKKLSLIDRATKKIKRIFFYAPTKEELAELEEIKRRKFQDKQLSIEAKAAKVRLINCLTRLGICYTRTTNKNTRTTKVKFDKIRWEPNAIWFRVNSHKLPHGVTLSQLVDVETINNLSMAVGHKVACRWKEDIGVWYCMERAGGTMGIPNHVQITEMWERMPASRDLLTIPVGITSNGRPIYQSLDEMTHGLIAGTTGGGKSNFLNMILCTLIMRNKPSQLQLLLVDLKGGLEFNYYAGIPHLVNVPAIAPGGIIYERDGVQPLLEWVIAEGEKRMKIFLEAKAKNIGEYNAHRTKHRMPHWLLVIDEWADVKLSKGGKETEEHLANAVQRMRAVGIHVLVCTQVPQSQVIGTLIKANMPGKFAFSCADLQGSMAILNNGHALNLQPKGRCIYRFQEEIAVQTPFIPKPIILEMVEGAKSGRFGELKKRHDVTEEEIREWALQNNDGYLPRRRIFEIYRSRGLTFEELVAWLSDWEDKTFLIGSFNYKVIPEVPGTSKGRRLVIVQDEPEPVK